jgi:hypothetical protein
LIGIQWKKLGFEDAAGNILEHLQLVPPGAGVESPADSNARPTFYQEENIQLTSIDSSQNAQLCGCRTIEAPSSDSFEGNLPVNCSSSPHTITV